MLVVFVLFTDFSNLQYQPRAMAIGCLLGVSWHLALDLERRRGYTQGEPGNIGTF